MSKHVTESTTSPGEFIGPYSPTDYGSCQYGHPVNCMGRCAPMNPYPGGTGVGCPTLTERTDFLALQDFDYIVATAIGNNITEVTILGIPVTLEVPLPLPGLTTEGTVRSLLVSLILTAEGF